MEDRAGVEHRRFPGAHPRHAAIAPARSLALDSTLLP
jgi:hypothetical protein